MQTFVKASTAAAASIVAIAFYYFWAIVTAPAIGVLHNHDDYDAAAAARKLNTKGPVYNINDDTWVATTREAGEQIYRANQASQLERFRKSVFFLRPGDKVAILDGGTDVLPEIRVIDSETHRGKTGFAPTFSIAVAPIENGETGKPLAITKDWVWTKSN